MVQIIGNYTLESQDNYKEYLISLGVGEEQAGKIAESKEGANISALDAESVTAAYGGKSFKYPLNKEVEHILGTGHTVWTTTTHKDNIITFKTKVNKEGTLIDEKVLNITDSGLTITSTNSKGVKAVRKYKRA